MNLKIWRRFTKSCLETTWLYGQSYQFSTCWWFFSMALNWIPPIHLPFILWSTSIQRWCGELSTFVDQFEATKWGDHFLRNRLHFSFLSRLQKWFWFGNVEEHEVSYQKTRDNRCSQALKENTRSYLWSCTEVTERINHETCGVFHPSSYREKNEPRLMDCLPWT